jgi:hypothetical protein
LPVLFAARFLPGIARGDVTLAFRRWTKPRARAGNRHRTPAGFIEIDTVDLVSLGDVSEEDSRRAGFDSIDELRTILGASEAPIYRVSFHRVDVADRRAELAGRSELTGDEVLAIASRLNKMDNSARAPWTGQTLELIHDHPGRRAGDLASMAGRETLDFKRDVRKLKEMGLTLSLEVGYRLSPRGETLWREYDKLMPGRRALDST